MDIPLENLEILQKSINKLKKKNEKLKKDLEHLKKLEKDLKYISEQDFQIYKFPNGRIIFGIDITNCPSEQEKVKRIFKEVLKEVLEDE